jgi:two-component system, OmpR family, phosphate regulon response regulator OmpR
MPQDRAHLLVVDDDSRLRELLRKYLTDNGFVVTLARDAAEARTKLSDIHFDMMVLDVMMPGETGFELTRAIRDDTFHPAHNTPILLLTAMAETENRIEGLESGADDYLAKPFEPKELVLRIQKILKRSQQPVKASKIVNLGEYTFDVERAELQHQSQPVVITTAEANLLKILALSPGRTHSRDDLAARTGVSLSPRTVDVQVTRLRRRIEPDPRVPTFIKTVRHKGYVLWPG